MPFLKLYLSVSIHPSPSSSLFSYFKPQNKWFTTHLCSTLSAEKCAFSIFRMIATKLFKEIWVNNSSQLQVRLHLRFKHWSVSFWYQRYVEIFLYIYKEIHCDALTVCFHMYISYFRKSKCSGCSKKEWKVSIPFILHMKQMPLWKLH